ncbi:MAG: hypothetical protein ACR2NR_01390 [Solirubrobacteraceae bacterium]
MPVRRGADRWRHLCRRSLYEAALHAAGGACELVRRLTSGMAEAGFCALRPAGHHAERDRAMGFCLFNNMAIPRHDPAAQQSGRSPSDGRRLAREVGREIVSGDLRR